MQSTELTGNTRYPIQHTGDLTNRNIERDKMKYFAFVSTMMILLAGCQPAARMAVREASRYSPSAISHSPYPALKSSIDALLPDSLFPPASVGIKIISLTRNETLYEVNPSLLFNPASNQKLFTAATALSVLGEATQSTRGSTRTAPQSLSKASAIHSCRHKTSTPSPLPWP